MQNKTISFFLLGILLFVFSACGSSKVAPPKKVETPKWVSIQPKDTSSFTYGLGIAKNREEALTSALNDVVSKLGVKVESSFTNKQIVNGYYSKSISTNNIKADVAKIRVTNYQVEQSHRISFREYAVLLKVDNKKFFNTLKQDIIRAKNTISNSLQKANNLDAISRYKTKKAMSKACEKLLSNTLVAHELNASFDKNSYFNFVANVKDSYYSEVNRLNFYVYGNANAQNFIALIKKELLENGFNVSNKMKHNSLKVNLHATDNIKINQKIVAIKLNIKVSDAGKTVGSNVLTMKERYKSSKSSIYSAAAVHFEQDLNTQGVEKILGIGIN